MACLHAPIRHDRSANRGSNRGSNSHPNNNSDHSYPDRGANSIANCGSNRISNLAARGPMLLQIFLGCNTERMARGRNLRKCSKERYLHHTGK